MRWESYVLKTPSFYPSCFLNIQSNNLADKQPAHYTIYRWLRQSFGAFCNKNLSYCHKRPEKIVIYTLNPLKTGQSHMKRDRPFLDTPPRLKFSLLWRADFAKTGCFPLTSGLFMCIIKCEFSVGRNIGQKEEIRCGIHFRTKKP